MTYPEYQEWAGKHTTRFGFNTEGDLKLFMEWFDVFKDFTAPDLAEATLRMSEGDYPGWAREHPKALLRLASLVRAERLQGDLDATLPPDSPSCVECGGSGWVSVPVLSRKIDGKTVYAIDKNEWVGFSIIPGTHGYYTCVVFCNCPLGYWKDSHWGREDFKPMRLDEYVRHNPNYRVQMRKREFQERQAAELERNGRRTAFDEVLDRLRAKCGIREPGEE